MSLFELLDPEAEGTTILRNAGKYRGADKSLPRSTSRCILLDGENISFDAILVLYIYIYIVLQL